MRSKYPIYILVAIGIFSFSSVIFAATLVKTTNADFSNGNASFDNVTSVNDDLRVAPIVNLSEGWYRGHY